MNKSELIAGVVERTELGKAEAERAVDAVFDTITEALKSGDEVRLVSFGIFTCVDKPEREGRNPSTGEKIKIPAKRMPKFKPGKPLKDAVE